MIKYFCDLCSQEISKASVRIDYRDGFAFDHHMYCWNCFLDQTKWKSIHQNQVQKEAKKLETMRKRLHLSSIKKS